MENKKRNLRKFEDLKDRLFSFSLSPQEHWGLWCKKNKNSQEREQVVVEAVLTQRTSWKNVKKAIFNLKAAKLLSLKEIANCPNRELEAAIRPAGFFKAKAQTLKEIAVFIGKRKKINSVMKIEWPQLRSDILALRGIGFETADSILLYALDKPVFVVDEYTRRLVQKEKLFQYAFKKRCFPEKITRANYEIFQDLFEEKLGKNVSVLQEFHARLVLYSQNKNGSDASEESLPKQYKRGYARFLGIKIDLKKGVFIPRPETEFWMRQAIKEVQKKKRKDLWALDIFSGSGCCGIAVLEKIPQSKVLFIDSDFKALSQIRLNLERLKIEKECYKVIRSEYFDNLSLKYKFDLIMANPPYVDPERLEEVQPSVLKHEPHAALFGGRKGLEAIEKFLFEVGKWLKRDGLIFLEFDPLQLKDVESLALSRGFVFKPFKDQFGQWRFARISRPKK